MITAKIIKHSIACFSTNEEATELVTFELEYPRFIHAENLTHRQPSKNSASSRAIPTKKMLDNCTAMPSYWGKNKPGMSASEEIDNIEEAKKIWLEALDSAKKYTLQLEALEVHKQISNRITEPWQMMKVVMSATSYENFFNLRDHPAAQPEIRILAQKMELALAKSKPRMLKAGEWHLPYITTFNRYKKYLPFLTKNKLRYCDSSGTELSLEEAKKVSVSCCAQVSYRALDDSLEKALKIYNMLVNSKPIHASPTEHVATPCTGSHGNFKNWIQLRQLIEQGVTC